jgi:hypothetical protein
MSDIRPVRLTATCLNLRHKLMYCDERHSTPGWVDVDSDTRVYFCMRSQESLGPDGSPVHPRDCSPGRRCYCGNSSSESQSPGPGPALQA